MEYSLSVYTGTYTSTLHIARNVYSTQPISFMSMCIWYKFVLKADKLPTAWLLPEEATARLWTIKCYIIKVPINNILYCCIL